MNSRENARAPRRPIMVSMWVGERLSYLEVLCIKSFVDYGYDFHLYTYNDVEGVPDGVLVRDASDILPGDKVYLHKSGHPAPHSDKFRYRLIAKNANYVWVDTDAYCLKEFPQRDGYVFGWGNSLYRSFIFSGVLSFGEHSRALRDLIDFTEDGKVKIPWKTDQGKVDVSQAEFTVWGPRALTYFLRKHGEDKYAFDWRVFYPIPSYGIEMILDANALISPLPARGHGLHSPLLVRAEETPAQHRRLSSTLQPAGSHAHPARHRPIQISTEELWADILSAWTPLQEKIR